MTPCCIVLFSLAVLGSVAQDVSVTEWATRTVAESSSVEFLCPATVNRWDLVQSSVLRYVVVERASAIGKYGCRSVFEKVDGSGVCKDGVSVNESLGSPLVISRISMGQAATYMCSFTAPDRIARVNAWNVTVVDDAAPVLTYEFDAILGFSNISSKIDVSNGTVIPFTCSTNYSGFHDPGLQLLLKDKDGVERLLNTSTPSDDTTFLSSVTSRVSTTYRVQATDGDFDILCRLRDLQINSDSTLHFRGPGSPDGTSSGLSQAAIIGVVVGVVAGVGLIVTVVAILVIICLKRRRAKQTSSNGDRAHPTHMTSVTRLPSYAGAGRPSVGQADIPPLYVQSHMRDSPVNNWLHASLSKTDFYVNAPSWALQDSGNLNESFSMSSTSRHPPTGVSHTIDEVPEQEEAEEDDVYEIVSDSSFDDDLAESQQHLASNEMRENRDR